MPYIQKWRISVIKILSGEFEGFWGEIVKYNPSRDKVKIAVFKSNPTNVIAIQWENISNIEKVA